MKTQITPEMKSVAVSTKFMRWAGLAAIVTGFIYLAVQLIHPSDTFGSVTTARWSVTHILSIVMDMLALIALTGIYAKQAHKTGIFGFIGYFLFSLFFALSLAFHFIEAFVFPVLASEAPKFVEGLQGLVTRQQSAVSLGAIPTVYMIVGISYLLGGVLLGTAIFRAAVLPRWAGGLLAIGALVTMLGAVIPHPIDRIMAVPVGLALIWLGWALSREDVSRERE